jgi:glucan-binding YG repeat protein
VIGKKTFYLNEKNGRLKLGWFKVSGKIYYATTGKGILTNMNDIDGQTYLFSSKGVLQTGWKTYNGNTYYCTRQTGAIAKGLGSISGKLYYFDKNGILQKNKVVTLDGVSYSIDANGICTKIATSSSTPEDMLLYLVRIRYRRVWSGRRRQWKCLWKISV